MAGQGELNKIIERENAMYDPSKEYFKEKGGYDDDYYKRREKKSFFNDLFDF